MKINLLNIGCFKNLVDSEHLMRALTTAGCDVHFGELTDYSDVAIINTCGFIGDADDASLATVKRYADLKRKGLCGALWIMGCYSQKLGERLRELVPEVDSIYGNFNWERIPMDLGLHSAVDRTRTITTPGHYAYVKISEGCNQPCSYCIKPVLNGPLKSLRQEDIIDECRWLVGQGVSEIQLVAQNLTCYGMDLNGKKQIAELVERIADIAGIQWIRLHYAYPLGFPKELLRVIKERPNVCNYLDMAIQHCNTRMLKLMRRGMTREQLEELIAAIREAVPGIYLRTTVMTGHPGETEEDYQELYRFVEEQRFERLGVFAYSHQSPSYAYAHYQDDIPERVKRNRAIELMNLQKEIYKELHRGLIGTTQRVVVDSVNGDKVYARSEYSTPMADPKIVVKLQGSVPEAGRFYTVRLTEDMGKDMGGVLV